MHMQTIPIRRRAVRLPSPTVPREEFERVCTALEVTQRLYDRQTIALHKRSVDLLNANDRIHELERLVGACTRNT